jgi:hypothetical protein
MIMPLKSIPIVYFIISGQVSQYGDQARGWMKSGSIPSRSEKFLSLDNMQTSRGESPIQWVPGAVSPGV